MKILYVANDSSLYGSNLALIELLKELKNKDVDFKVLIPKKGPFEEILKKNNINYKIIRYCTSIKKISSETLFKNQIKKIINFFSLRLICFWIRHENFDIVHSNSLAVDIGAAAAQKLKIKHIWHIRELLEEDHNLEFQNKNKSNKLLEKSNVLIFISKAVEKKYSYIKNRNKYLVYDGIEKEKKDFYDKNFEKKDSYKILISGSINGNKGHDDAIFAIKELITRRKEKIILYIAGTGIKEKIYKEIVKKNKLEDNIFFLGFIKNLDEIREKIDISLTCSKFEALGRVTIEAMMKENIVIAANSGGTIEIIENFKNGLLYNQGDYLDLANKIELVLDGKLNCNFILRNAYNDSFERFNIQKYANEIFDIYLKTMELKDD